MAITKTVNPTRMELSRQKQRLSTAQKGYRLLKDKLDELMRQFLDTVKETMKMRMQTNQKLLEINRKFVLAEAMADYGTLQTALLLPNQAIRLDTEFQNIMNVMIPKFTFNIESDTNHALYPYGYAFTPFELDDAILDLSKLLPDLLLLAEREKACYLMADEIEKTRRRVNALEHIMIPEYRRNIRYITMKLDENERGNQIRLIKIKEGRNMEMREKKGNKVVAYSHEKGGSLDERE